ncbi:MAG: hypothetical protein Solivirus1_72 [Solivirus sp.]|uniref:Uncharacterized protein n=1 Tax=Solivirus sp. TaxID=2487772 RepID=A0A3G5AFB8_9VIRU|nr:MAG: hypothetical protein Solivirus1_72 [Solivirus sp.]
MPRRRKNEDDDDESEEEEISSEEEETDSDEEETSEEETDSDEEDSESDEEESDDETPVLPASSSSNYSYQQTSQVQASPTFQELPSSYGNKFGIKFYNYGPSLIVTFPKGILDRYTPQLSAMKGIYSENYGQGSAWMFDQSYKDQVFRLLESIGGEKIQFVQVPQPIVVPTFQVAAPAVSYPAPQFQQTQFAPAAAVQQQQFTPAPVTPQFQQMQFAPSASVQQPAVSYPAPAASVTPQFQQSQFAPAAAVQQQQFTPAPVTPQFQQTQFAPAAPVQQQQFTPAPVTPQFQQQQFAPAAQFAPVQQTQFSNQIYFPPAATGQFQQRPGSTTPTATQFQQQKPGSTTPTFQPAQSTFVPAASSSSARAPIQTTTYSPLNRDSGEIDARYQRRIALYNFALQKGLQSQQADAISRMKNNLDFDNTRYNSEEMKILNYYYPSQ